MKFIIFDINDNLKNSRIGYATITSNPLNHFRNNSHTNFILLKTTDFETEGSFVSRLAGDTLTLSTGKTGKVIALQGNFLLFEPDNYFKTLRTGWIRQIDVTKMEDEDPCSKSFFILSEKAGPKDWERTSFDADGLLDFGKEPIKGIALLENFDKLT